MTESARFCLYMPTLNRNLRFESQFDFSTKYDGVRDSVMLLGASNKVSCNLWSYDFGEMKLQY